MFGLAFLKGGASPNDTFWEKLQNGASAQTCVFVVLPWKQTDNKVIKIIGTHVRAVFLKKFSSWFGEFEDINHKY